MMIPFSPDLHLKRAVYRLLLCTPLLVALRLTIFVRRRLVDDYAAVDGYALVQIALVGLTVLAILASGRLIPMWAKIIRNSMGMFLLYYVLGAATALWSPSFSYSCYRAVEALSQFLAVFLVMDAIGSFPKAERLALGIAELVLVMGFACEIKQAEFHVSLEALHTNQYSVIGLLIFCYCLGELFSGLRPRDTRFLLGHGLVGLGAVIIGTSTASFFSAIGGVLAAALLSPRRGRMVFLVVGLMVILVAGVGVSGITRTLTYGKTETQLTTLHGRTQLWGSYWRQFQEQPVLGAGYAISARTNEDLKNTNTHNSFFAVALGAGCVGLALLGLSALRFVREALGQIRRLMPGALGCTAAILAGAVNSLSVSYIFESWSYVALPFAFFLALFALHVVHPSPEGRVVRLRLVKIEPEEFKI